MGERGGDKGKETIKGEIRMRPFFIMVDRYNC